MSCDELRDHYQLYALGVAEDPERGEIREHLARQCPACTTGVREGIELAAVLGAAPELDGGPKPSRRLRGRILASVGGGQWSFGWSLAWAAAAVFCLFAAVYFNGRERQYTEEAARLRQQLGSQTVTLARLNEMLAILNATDTTEVAFGQGQPRPPRGRVYVNARRGVLLIASNLPPAPPSKVFEMWVIPKGGRPLPAGVFHSEPDGSAIHMASGPVEAGAGTAVALTIENEGGAPQPTSQPLFAAVVPAEAPQ